MGKQLVKRGLDRAIEPHGVHKPVSVAGVTYWLSQGVLGPV